MFTRTVLAILAPLVLVACDPQVRANEQEPAANTAAAAAPDQFFQQSPAPLLGSQPGQVLLAGNNPGPQIPVATANVYSPPQFASGASQVGLRSDVGDRVFFTTDSAVLDPRGAGVVDQLAAWMRQYPRPPFALKGMRTSGEPVTTTSRWVTSARPPSAIAFSNLASPLSGFPRFHTARSAPSPPARPRPCGPRTAVPFSWFCDRLTIRSKCFFGGLFRPPFLTPILHEQASGPAVNGSIGGENPLI